MDDPDLEARDARVAWRAGRLGSDLENVPEGLWHYTNAGGLQGILETDKIWASDPRFLNDATEFNYGLEVAEEAIEAAVRSGRWKGPTNQFLKHVMASDGGNLPGFVRANSQVFVACLCEDGDLLSQWRAYAGLDNVGGYALEFRHRSPLSGWIEHRGGALRLQRVIYDRGHQLAAFADLIHRLAPVYDIDHSERRMKALSENLVDGISEFATFCKHPTFREEREWRVVYERTSDPKPLDIKYRISRGLFIPYVALELPAAVGAMAGHLPISAVRCGPTAEPDLKQQGLTRLFRSLPTFRNVQVSGSESPIRI